MFRGRILVPEFFYALHRDRQQKGYFQKQREVVWDMDNGEKRLEELGQEELVEYLRQLAAWKNNDVVKLAFLEPEDRARVDELDLTGVVELKRNTNGTFEAKFVDKVRVLTMLRELMDERRDGELGAFLDGLYGQEDGDET